MKKRFFAALLSLCLLVGLVPGMGTAAFAASQHKIGDTVEFAGHDWYIIGTESDGVNAPSGCYTLFAKNDDFGSTAFREDGKLWGDPTVVYYMDSDLQKKMKEVENAFSAEDKANIVARDTLDGIAGGSPTGQLLWPLSKAEVEILDPSIQKFEKRYLTRTGDESYFYVWCVEMISQTPSISGYSVDVDDFSVRPALYVKAEALKGNDGREVELRNNGTHIQWRYAGEGDSAWRDLVALDSITGDDGADGADGREVQLRVDSGYIQWKYDTDSQWTTLLALSDLKGADGADGEDGEDGHEVELQNNGTSIQWRYEGETEWKDLVDLSDLTGADGSDGADGKQVELRVESGYIQWKYDADSDWQNLIALSALQGIKGDKGDKGDPGEDGDTPYIGDNGNWWIGGVDTGIPTTGSSGSDGADGSDGKDGRDGEDGKDGLTPYIGSNGNWWIGTTDTGIKTTGTNGADGKDGVNSVNGKYGADGKDGTNGEDGADGVGVADIKLNENGELIVTLIDGTEKNLGKVKGEDGVGISGVSINENGELIVTLTDGTELNAGAVPTAAAGDSSLKTLVYVSIGTAGVSLAGLLGLLAFLLTKRKSLIGK